MKNVIPSMVLRHLAGDHCRNTWVECLVSLASAQEARERLNWAQCWSESQVNKALAHNEGVPKSSRPDREHCPSCWSEHWLLC